MRIILTASQVPFEQGGAELHIRNLFEALKKAGHDVELVRFPFKFYPYDYIEKQMDYVQQLDFNNFTHHKIDRVISLQFPSYGISHNNHVIWVMHQHRAVYELFPRKDISDDLNALRHKIMSFDNFAFSKARRIFANSKQVATRLKHNNHVDSLALYHPPPDADNLYCAADYGYIFYPSRIEPLKRQHLLIEAAQHTKSNVKFIIAGTGTAFDQCQEQINQLGLQDKVIMMGRFSDHEKPTLYARALGVFFGPFDEDYGYITLEAQLSSKPVITCEDSGGPLEFVENEHNGFICPADPKALAEKFDWLYNHRTQAAIMGEQGKKDYLKRNISWRNVVTTLLRDD